MAIDDVLPRRNLPDDAEPWGREIETRISNYGRAIDAIGQSLGNQNRSQSGTLTVVGQQLQTIANQQAILTAQQETLTAQQATLTTQQGLLTAQQADLTAAVAEISALQDNVVVPRIGTDSSTSFTVGTGWTTILNTTIARPSGYGNVIVNLSGQCSTVFTASGGSSSDTFYVRVGINGNYGPVSRQLTSVSGALAAFHALSFATTGTVTITLQAHTDNNPGLNAAPSATLVGTGFWTR